MTDPELIDTLADTLEVLAGKFRARLDSPSGFDLPALRGILKHAEAVALDHLTSLGTGLPTCLRDTTWERVRLALARHGRPVGD